jgi:Uma2 family endonuclease
MPEATRLVTADELERFRPADDGRYELVEGRIIRMSPVGYQHGRVVMRLSSMLDEHIRSRDLGVVFPEVGFTLRSNPDTVRAPDLAFIRRERIPSVEPRGFWKGPPDLAIEVLSPEDRPSEIRRKAEEYLNEGVPLVLVVDADQKSVTVYRASTPPTTLASDEILDIGDVVAGFRCSVQRIFE